MSLLQGDEKKKAHCRQKLMGLRISKMTVMSQIRMRERCQQGTNKKLWILMDKKMQTRNCLHQMGLEWELPDPMKI